jgi:pimeloyl-ACP methyl ester carboxylesterase
MRVIFVHGTALGDATWWWHRMYQPLRDHGLRTASVELPSCGRSGGDLHADGDSVRAVLDESEEPAALVGHSYGGMVITDAGEHPVVRHLLYVSAVLPDAGESLLAMADPRSPGWLEAADDDSRVRLRSNLTDEEIHFHFTGDCDAETAREARARLASQSAAAFAQPPRTVSWRTVPSTFVLCTQDRATPPAVPATWAGRARRIIEIPTGHHPFLPGPDLLADVIADCVIGQAD